MLMKYETGSLTIKVWAMPWNMTKADFSWPLKNPINEKSTAVTMASGPKPLR